MPWPRIKSEMETFPAPNDLACEPQLLSRALALPGEREFLREGGSTYTLGTLRRHAAGVAAKLREDRERGLHGVAAEVPAIGVHVRSAFDFAACVLGAWEARFAPVLLDPSSRSELDTLFEALPGIRLLAPPELCPPPRGLPLPAPGNDAVLRAPLLGEPMVTFFTSGSEGRPKLVPKIGRQVYGHVAAASSMLNVPGSCRVLSFVPLFHILGFAYGFMVPLHAGGQTFVVTGQSPAAMRQALLAFRPHLVVATAVHYRFLNSSLTPADSLPEATYISSGAPLLAKDRDEFAAKSGRSIVELFGSTETAGIAWRRGDTPWTPYPGVKFKIESEALWVQSPWAHPEDVEGWVETHDAAEPQEAGFRLLGRSGSIVKIGGKRFSSLEVEQALLSHPGVEDAAVLPFERYGEPAVAAFVVLKSHSGASLADLRSFLAARLAPFKVPRAIHSVPVLPRRKLEKLDYAELSKMARGEGETSV